MPPDDIDLPFDLEEMPKERDSETKKTVPDTDFTLVSRGIGPFRDKYRPQKLNEVVPTCSLELIQNQIDNPNASKIYLFEGKTGTGKTTCAHILAKAHVCSSSNSLNKPCLQCDNCKLYDTSFDKIEINASSQNKIDDIRQILDDMRYRPSILPKKIYILDEAHRLTDASQNALLEDFETPFPYLLVFMCTTSVKDLNKTLVDRACRITFSDMTEYQAVSIINQVVSKESIPKLNEDQIETLYYKSQGSVRALLNLLDIYKNSNGDPTAFNWDDEEIPPDVVTLFEFIHKGDWAGLAEKLKKPKIKKEAESLRLGLENYIRGIILSKPTISEAALYANAFKMLSGSLTMELPISQYNQFVFKCLNACNIFKKSSSGT